VDRYVEKLARKSVYKQDFVFIKKHLDQSAQRLVKKRDKRAIKSYLQ
jgi:hypothetical protein